MSFIGDPPALRACLHIDCPHHACVNPTLSIEVEDLHREIARLEFRIAALEARPTIQWWPPTYPSSGTSGVYQCWNCKTWISYGVTHTCNWTAVPSTWVVNTTAGAV